jgi:hypothetical protein
MTLTKGWIRNAAATPLDVRRIEAASWAVQDVASRLGIRPGIVDTIIANDLVATTATMNVTVGAFSAVLTKGASDGAVPIANDGSVNVLIGAAPGSNSRIDVIYVKHNDDTTGDANANPIFGVAVGTAAASPTKPSIPTGALELATLRIYAGTTATNGGSNVLTNTYQMTAPRGGVVPFRSKADLDAWTTAVPGQRASIYDVAAGLAKSLWQWSGVAWEYIGRAHALARASSVRNVGTAADTILTFGTAAVLNGGFGFTANAFVIPETGVYRVCAYGLFAANATGRRELAFYIDGVRTDEGLGRVVPGSSASDAPVLAEWEFSFNALQTVSVYAYQNSGSTLGVTQRFLSVERVA